MFTYNNGRVVIHRITKDNKYIITENGIKTNNKFNDKLISLPQNDTGNAKRFLLFCKDFAKYNSTQQVWLLWNGKVWSSENSYDELIKLAQAVMEKYYNVVKSSTTLDDSAKKTILYHAKTSGNRGNLDNILVLAAHMNYVKEMQCKSYLLNVQNGIVNLKTKELIPHHPQYGCTSICRCAYNPNAKSSRFKSFVKEITDYNHELYDYLKTTSGYFATGLRREEKFFVYWGKTGQNGKSKYLEILEYTLGSYASLFPTNALTKTNNDASRPTPELVPLIGIRYAHTSELEGNNVINDACIKQYTGNSHIMIRKMRQEYAKVDIFFKIAIDTNHEPKFRRFDDAIKRRLVIIPFNKKFEGKNRDLALEQKLQNDCEYVLKWIIDGAYDYYKYGLQEPAIVREATEEYCSKADSIKSFLNEATIYEQGSLVKSSVLHQAYVNYCQYNSYTALDIKSFSQLLAQKGFEKKQKNTGAYFKDLKLI